MRAKSAWKLAYLAEVLQMQLALQVHALEQQLQETSSQRQVLDASHEQLQQQRERLIEQLRNAQSECQSTKTHLEQRQALFEEEANSLQNALSRHKEERIALEHDKQGLHSFVQELTKRAEVTANFTAHSCSLLCTGTCTYAAGVLRTPRITFGITSVCLSGQSVLV